MHVASLELCRELYKVSGWWPGELTDLGLPDRWWNWLEDDDGNNIRCVEIANSKSNRHWRFSAPAYDCGYLLRQLALKDVMVGVGKDCPWAAESSREECLEAENQFYTPYGEGNTPEDALCKLAIELFKQGILKRAAAPKEGE
jgi:hypothetical protein